jgi:formyltetrahydrofolate deformylase
VRGQFGWTRGFHAVAQRPRLLLMVSQHGHCLNDLLFRWRTGQLDVDIPAIVSNHPTTPPWPAATASPSTTCRCPPGSDAAAKRAQEREVEALVASASGRPGGAGALHADPQRRVLRGLRGRAINIHHSFLPSFKGAKPYYQAHARGVKLIGATAHYVTADLDEGPIIEQDVERVDHSLSADDFTAVGRDVECVVLARAVRWHVEHRVLINGHKTVVFR